MKKVLALLLALIMVVALVGCSNGGAASSSSSTTVTVTESTDSVPTDTEAAWDTSKEDEIVLSVMNNYYTSGWQKMAEDYMALHPETKVTVDVVADNDTYSQKMTTWMSAGNMNDASDIVHINFGDINLMFNNDWCYDFSNLLGTTNPYTGKPVEACMTDADIAAFTNEYGIYSLPFDHVGVAMMVNTTMLADNGLEVPTTMEEWLNCCEVLKANGIDTPVLSTAEGAYFITILADAAMRDWSTDLIYKPEDGGYDANTMSANDGYVFDVNDPMCDQKIVYSGERVAMKEQETQFKTDIGTSVWAEYAKYAPYFNENYLASSSTEVLSSFEMGNGAFLVSGSWNVGVLNADMQELGDDGFEWETIAFPNYATTPEGWCTGNLRSLYVMGNCMGILKTGDEDHLARVLDFYMYVYNPTGCATMYETTLNDGYFVQGPVAISGVELPAELQAKLDGFVQEACEKGDQFAAIMGKEIYLSEDQGTYQEYFNQLSAGTMTAEQFVDAIQPLALKKLADNIDKNGYDMDPATKDEMKA